MANGSENGDAPPAGNDATMQTGNVSESSNEGDDNEMSLNGVELGGPIDESAFALLDGLYESPDERPSYTRVTVPLTRLPAILGRTHATKDRHFFGLGKHRAVSRQQCVIYYRDRKGGRVGMYDNNTAGGGDDDPEAQLSYQPNKAGGEDKLVIADERSTVDASLPEEGFYVIECLGKNRILVDGMKIDQGKSIRIKSGSTIRISSYLLYFVLPLDATPKEHVVSENTESAVVPTDKAAPAPSESKRKIVDELPSQSSTEGAEPKAKKARTTTTLQAELEAATTEQLLDRMTRAMEEGLWDRKTQSVASTIAYRALRDAAKSEKLQIESQLSKGVARATIVEWVDESPKYTNWVKQMRSKMEDRPYQLIITRMLLKAGYDRVQQSGRYINWYLPKDIPITAKLPGKGSDHAADNGGDGDKGVNEDEGGEGGDDEEEDVDEEEDEGGDEEEDADNSGEGNGSKSVVSSDSELEKSGQTVEQKKG